VPGVPGSDLFEADILTVQQDFPDNPAVAVLLGSLDRNPLAVDELSQVLGALCTIRLGTLGCVDTREADLVACGGHLDVYGVPVRNLDDLAGMCVR